jgi:hypothetical protein
MSTGKLCLWPSAWVGLPSVSTQHQCSIWHCKKWLVCRCEWVDFWCKQCSALMQHVLLYISVVDEISLSRNFAKYLFRISRNNFLYFAKFREISYREILRNFAKYREIFVTKLKFSLGKMHFWIFLHFNTTKKITFMSKVH